MKRALLSVSDKTGVVEVASGLHHAGYEIVSSGGTAAELERAGLPVTRVDEVTGHPEILDGRVKTLHPRIHAGLLARDTPAHAAELAAHGIQPFDVLVVNLYPFERTLASAEASVTDVIEAIDIGGPAMIRAAAKTFERVAVVTDPSDYGALLEAVGADALDLGLRRRWARKAFSHTAAYDAAIATWLTETESREESADEEHRWPERLHVTLELAQPLRYGENPHQVAARYRLRGEDDAVWGQARVHKGTALSYLNVFDGDAAWRLAHAFDRPAVVIVKHANPCGVAVGDTLVDAYQKALQADPTSAFGGVVAIAGAIDVVLAQAIMAAPKADVVMARSIDPEALTILEAKRSAMRVLELPAPRPHPWEVRRIAGGFLAQSTDVYGTATGSTGPEWTVVSRKVPDPDTMRDLRFAWTVCAATSSNAIVVAKDGVAVGVGAGQQSRVDAARIAVQKAAGRAEGGVCASDAFFPFRDGLDVVIDAGVTAVVQPGGSVRDDEIVAVADERQVAMIMTHRRHFRH